MAVLSGPSTSVPVENDETIQSELLKSKCPEICVARFLASIPRNPPKQKIQISISAELDLTALWAGSFIALQYTLLYIYLTFLFDICFWRLLRNFPSIHFQNGHLSILDTFLIFPRYGDPIVHKTEFIKKNYGFLCQIFERRILRPSLRSTVVLGWEHRKHQTKNEKKHKRKDMQQRCHKWG